MNDLRKIGLSKEKPNLDNISVELAVKAPARSTKPDIDVLVEDIAIRYQADLYHVYQHYAKDYSGKGMTLDEFLVLVQDLSLVDSNTLSLETIVRISVNCIMYVGDGNRQQISFPQFIRIIVKCCDVKLFDGCTPLHQVRVNTYFARIFFAVIDISHKLCKYIPVLSVWNFLFEVAY
jgi:hypothetical protein